jgi:hypothetical protein
MMVSERKRSGKISSYAQRIINLGSSTQDLRGRVRPKRYGAGSKRLRVYGNMQISWWSENDDMPLQRNDYV